MKKLLKMILSLGFVISPTSVIVSCGEPNSQKDPKEDSCIEPKFNNLNEQIKKPNKLTKNKSSYTKWQDANPNRKDNVTNKIACNHTSYFSPYLDAGLYEGNEIKDVVKASGLNHITLAFVQQVNSHNNFLDLSIAGIESSGPNYDWWAESVFYEKDLKPLVETNSFKNIKVAYGGASTGGNTIKNPWNLALKLENNKDKASILLEEALINYNKKITELASKKSGKSLIMPKNIDFDIEGAAQSEKEPNSLLANTIANMKIKDINWDFSVTLPVLPTGLTSVGISVMDEFVKAYKEKNISQDNLPIINLMLMDYGDQIYLDAIKKGQTNFDMAKEAIENTKNNLKDSIKRIYGSLNIEENKLFELIGATPMIGVNDTVEGVFTLEDAKDLYNYVHENSLAYLSVWSMNDDRGRDKNGNIIPKSLTSHGLNYLNEYDFSKAFNGIWDKNVLRPNKEI